MNAQVSRLSVADLAKKYNNRNVVDDVSLHVKSGEIVGLLGPNGAGKTTIFYMIVGLVKPDHGEISVDGFSITKMAMHARARFGLGYLPQEPSVFRKLTVAETYGPFLKYEPILVPVRLR